jgi:hypothetical protein
MEIGILLLIVSSLAVSVFAVIVLYWIFLKKWHYISLFLVSVFLLQGLLRDYFHSSREFYLEWISYRFVNLFAGSVFLAIALIIIFKSLLQGKSRVNMVFVEKNLAFLFVLSPFLFANGLLRQNDPVLIVGDIYKWILIPLIYFVVINTIPQKQAYRALEIIVFVSFIYMVLGAFLSAKYIFFESKATSFGDIKYLFPLVFSFLALNLIKEKRRFYLLMYLLSICLIIITNRRALWIEMILVHLLILLIFRKKIAITRVAVRICAVGGVLLIGIFSVPLTRNIVMQVIPTLGQRLSSIPETEQSLGLTSARIMEVQQTLELMSMNGPFLNYTVGMGPGAVFFAPHTLVVEETAYLQEGFRHTIHITPMNIFFRTGLIGLIAFYYFIYKILILIFHNMKKKNGNIQKHILLAVTSFYLIIAFIDSFKAYGLVGDPLFAFLLGLTGIMFRSTDSDMSKPDKSKSIFEDKDRLLE